MHTPPPAIAARLMYLNGDAWVQQGDAHLPLSVGTLLDEGQVVLTGPGCHLQLLLASGHELAIGPEQMLSLDSDVLANNSADSSEWLLSTHADASLLADWLLPATAAAIPLESVLEPHHLLDNLFGPAGQPSSGDMVSGALAGDDTNLNHLLRSLYGPDVH